MSKIESFPSILCENSVLAELSNQPHRLSAMYLLAFCRSGQLDKLKFQKLCLKHLTVMGKQGRQTVKYTRTQFYRDLARLVQLGLLWIDPSEQIQLVPLVKNKMLHNLSESSLHEIDRSFSKESGGCRKKSEKSSEKVSENTLQKSYNNSLTLNSLYTAGDQDLQKPIHDDFKPSEKLINDLQSIPDCPNPSDLLELAKFIAHHQHRGTRSSSWDAAYRCWLLKGAEYNRKLKLKEKDSGTTYNNDFRFAASNPHRAKHPNTHQKPKANRHGGFDEFMAGIGDDLRPSFLELLRPTSEHGVAQGAGETDSA